MAKKVIIDCDPGIDGAVALCIALLEPELEVLAVTATEGNASAEQATRNVQAIIESLDPPRTPRVGSATAGLAGSQGSSSGFHGMDGLGGCGPAASVLHNAHSSDKLICDIVRSDPGAVTIVTLGPLTNIARAFRRDPELPSLVGRIVMMAGSVEGIGDITPAAEFNVHFDPEAAREVFLSPANKTLIPLDVTRRIVFSLDIMNHLPPRPSRIGDLLNRMLTFSFRAHRQWLGMEGIYLHDVVACMAAICPQWTVTTDIPGDVETRGELTLGATVFDRRKCSHARANLEVALQIEQGAVQERILASLRRIGQFG